MYRFASLVVEGEGLPLGGCLFVEAAIVPLLMALADGLLLAWVLVELRAATPEADGGQGFDVAGTVALTPMAALACVAALPARYVAVGSYLILNDISSLKTRTPLPMSRVARPIPLSPAKLWPCFDYPPFRSRRI